MSRKTGRVNAEEVKKELREEFGSLVDLPMTYELEGVIQNDADEMTEEFKYHCGYNRFEAENAAAEVIEYESF